MIKLALSLALVVVGTGCSAESAQTGDEQTAPLTGDSPIALSGNYRFGGTVEAVGRLTVDVVDIRMSGAQQRLADLRASGAECTLVISNTYRCTDHSPAGSVPATSLAELGTKHAQGFATFGEVTGSPSLISQAEGMTEWTIHQKGSTGAGPFTEYQYAKLQGDLVKITLPGNLELIVADSDHVKQWDQAVVHEGQWRWHQDSGLVVFAR